MPKTTNKWRVRIAIYDDVESTAEEPYVSTDDWLYPGAPDAEIVQQAHRTYRQFDNKQALEQ